MAFARTESDPLIREQRENMHSRFWLMVARSKILLMVTVIAMLLVACGGEEEGDGSADSGDTDSAPSDAPDDADDDADDSGETDSAAGNSQGVGEDCDELTPVTVRLNWVYNYNQVPLMVAADRGYYEDECLDVSLEAGQGSADTVTSVASGVAEIGLSDAIAVMQGQAEDLPVTGVGVLWRQNAFAVIVNNDALEEHGIDEDGLEPDDLEGMRLGAVTTGSPYIFWQAFMEQQGIDPEKIDEVSVAPPGFAELAQGSVDFIANFTGARFALERQGADISMMRGQDFGQTGYGLSFIANDDWLDEEGSDEAVRGFLAATGRGMMFSGEKDEEAMEHVAAFNPDVGLDEEAAEQERQPHLDAVELWAEGGMDAPEDFLGFSEEGLEETQALLYDAEVLEGEPFDVTERWTDEYLPESSEWTD